MKKVGAGAQGYSDCPAQDPGFNSQHLKTANESNSASMNMWTQAFRQALRVMGATGA